MKFDLGIHSFMEKNIYNLQTNFSQCSNVENYDAKVSLFQCDVMVLDF